MADNKLTVEDKMTIKELEDKIKSMKEDKEKKCKAAKEQLINMLEVTVDKYRTATGTAEALRILRFAKGDDKVPIDTAVELAYEMSSITNAMMNKAKDLSYGEMDKLCDGFYNKEYKSDSYFTLAYEMMCIDLCRNVGGAAEDMVEFIKRVESEIDQTGEELKKLRAKEK